jgi:hypothetical protein
VHGVENILVPNVDFHSRFDGYFLKRVVNVFDTFIVAQGNHHNHRKKFILQNSLRNILDIDAHIVKRGGHLGDYTRLILADYGNNGFHFCTSETNNIADIINHKRKY